MSDDSRRTPDADYEDYTVVRDGERRQDVEWIGLTYGAGYRTAKLFDPDDERIYEADVDDDERHARLDEGEERELDDDETLGDYVADVGDDLGWSWLSGFAHDHLETTGQDAAMHVIDATFDRRSIPESTDYDLGFFGSFTYRDDDGHVHTLEREFDVYTEPDRRTETGQPVAVLEETFVEAAAPDEDSRPGDANVDEQMRREIPVDVDPDATDERAAIDEYCREWHESHPDPL